MPLPPGHILNERYSIIEQIGGGSFGETYLAEDLWQENNRCVVKRLIPEMINPLVLRLFKHEAEFLCKLAKNDQIPQLFAHFQENQDFYLVQELIEGNNLTKEIKPGTTWSESDVICLLEDILEILQFVHDNQVIHRDIKPANIMRRKSDGKIVLIDFGGIKQVRSQKLSTVLTPVVGTGGYMPDEQFRNQAQPCSDIYAVGMMAIQALTGLRIQHLPRDEKIPHQLYWRDKVNVSNELGDVLDKMVEFHYSKRYQSASEALDAVKRAGNLLSSRFQSALSWLQRGNRFIGNRDYEQGIAAYDKAISYKQNFYQAWYHRGIALKQLKRYEDAIASYDQAIEIIDCEQAWYSRGIALHERGSYEDAIASYERAVEIKPDYYQAIYRRGLALYDMGSHEKAIQSYKQALHMKSDYPEALTGLGMAFSQIGEYKKALKFYKQALSINPNYKLAIKERRRIRNILIRDYIIYSSLLLCGVSCLIGILVFQQMDYLLFGLLVLALVYILFMCIFLRLFIAQ